MESGGTAQKISRFTVRILKTCGISTMIIRQTNGTLVWKETHMYTDLEQIRKVALKSGKDKVIQ